MKWLVRWLRALFDRDDVRGAREAKALRAKLRKQRGK
jgi:hypothetical protein